MEIKKRKPTGRPPISETIKNAVIKLYNDDSMTCEDIAKVCNISKSSVFRIIKKERQTINE